MVLIIAHNLYSDNHKNNFIVFVEGPTYDINDSIGATEKKVNISFSKAKTKFCLSLYYNGDINYLFIHRKEIYKFKADKTDNFATILFRKHIYEYWKMELPGAIKKINFFYSNKVFKLTKNFQNFSYISMTTMK